MPRGFTGFREIATGIEFNPGTFFIGFPETDGILPVGRPFVAIVAHPAAIDVKVHAKAGAILEAVHVDGTVAHHARILVQRAPISVGILNVGEENSSHRTIRVAIAGHTVVKPARNVVIPRIKDAVVGIRQKLVVVLGIHPGGKTNLTKVVAATGPQSLLTRLGKRRCHQRSKNRDDSYDHQQFY